MLTLIWINKDQTPLSGHERKSAANIALTRSVVPARTVIIRWLLTRIAVKKAKLPQQLSR
jgi:hypothetical protein